MSRCNNTKPENPAFEKPFYFQLFPSYMLNSGMFQLDGDNRPARQPHRGTLIAL